MSIKVGDKVKATPNYYGAAMSPAEVQRAEENGGLFGTVLKVDGSVYRVKWEDAPGFDPNYDIILSDEIEKVDG
jgi:hypothetical protein